MFSASIRATAASTGTEGWHTPRCSVHRRAAEQTQDLDHVIDIVVEIEEAFGERHHARIGPVGDVDVMSGQEGLDRAAQQGRVMSRHRRDDQQLGLRRARPCPLRV